MGWAWLREGGSIRGRHDAATQMDCGVQLLVGMQIMDVGVSADIPMAHCDWGKSQGALGPLCTQATP